MTIKQKVLGIGSLIVIALLITFGINMFTTVGAGEHVVKQGIFDGHMEVWTQPGLYCQCLGKITRYPKSDQYWFSKNTQEGKSEDQSIGVRFSDGGNGRISGSLSFNLPTDHEAMLKLHATYGSMEAVERRLIRQVVTKAVYMSGPFMSSRESASERRPDLINFITDQVSHGVYKTKSDEVKQLDILSGQEKTVRIIQPAPDLAHPGIFLREEKSPVEEFGLSVYNITINNIDYDEVVEKQIKIQQESIAAVQTQMAQARMAEQKLLTTTSEGKAASEKAKWEQEVLKTKAVTEAEQGRDVAKLGLETANLEKQTQIQLGEGEAKRKKLVMEADGALAQKLEAWVEVNKAYADAMSKQPLVPSVIMGSDGKNTPNSDIFQLMAVKTAKDLSLDFRPNADKK
jgi:regulator of protease activity HflC (stomatin/prohibitin superfamily)